MKSIVIISVSALIAAAVANAEQVPTADRPAFSVGLSCDYLIGLSEYEITFPDGGSRLEWPIETLLIGPDGAVSFSGNRFVAKFAYRTNVTDKAGQLKDYDWSPLQMQALGVIETEMTAHLFDFSFVWNCVRRDDGSTLGIGAGYAYEYLNWEADDTLIMTYYNWDFGYAPGKYNEGRKKWVTYKINFHLPYLLVDGRQRLNEIFSARALVKLMLVIASDEDDHVYREKLSQSDYIGLGTTIGVEGRADLPPGFYAALFVQYTYLYAEGEQDQRFYDGSGLRYNNIDAKTEGPQLQAGAKAGFAF